MDRMRKLAYLFFIIILIGLAIHAIEFFSSQTLFGLFIAVIGLVGEIIVFGIHLNEKRSRKAEKFRWKLSHIGVVAIILIIIGIIVNIICTFFFRDYVGVGNHFITWGFIVAVIGFFIYVVKEKGFK